MRKYVPYAEKHKWPKGFGSLCPHDMPLRAAVELLEVATPVEGVGKNKLWAAKGEWCFCAHRGSEPDTWHGFPVVGTEVDERVLEVLHEIGQITAHERRRLRRQRELPEAWQ